MKCNAQVYVRDAYRYTGRSKTGFELHYKRRQCRNAAKDNGFCWQHQHTARLADIMEFKEQ